MLKISNSVFIATREIEMTAIRSQGSGGQNVNKVSSAIHLKFDIRASSLPVRIKARLLELNDRRISKKGVIIIKAQQFKSQIKNKEEALTRLQVLVKLAIQVVKKRKPSKVSRNQKRKRLDGKSKRGKLKSLRRSPKNHEET